MNDPFVDEIRKIRDAHAARFNYDLEAIYRDIKEREKERERTTGRKFIPPPRRAGSASAAAGSTPAPLLPTNTTLPERSRADER
jgi:hypothetical protein